ncbi:MAG: glycosyltransferase [Bacteriovorax sp.]|nr:glycosyltransferase [Bacteriovorax sp.]
MNIALVLEGDLQGGGGYQQQLSTIIELKKNNKYNVVAFVFSEDNKKVLESFGITAVYVANNIFDRIFRAINRMEWFYAFSLKFKFKTLFERKLDESDIDLVYFLSPSFLSLDLLTHNFIFTNWDLSHRDTPEFPEVNHYREFERRQDLYTKSLTKAVAVLVDSPLGKQNVTRRYGVDEARVYVAPFAPSVNSEAGTQVDIKAKYAIPEEYIYYPAQLWSHKNHVYIIDAISLLKNEGIRLTAIFSGSNKGNLNHILSYAQSKGVSELIKYIGFAPNEEIYSLYKNSLAMVMPSFFGPTNIPPLEAFAIGVPVVYSDIDGLRDQVADAALLCDLKNTQNLADHLKGLLASDELRQSLIKKGSRRLEELREVTVINILENILEDYAIKLKTWKK